MTSEFSKLYKELKELKGNHLTEKETDDTIDKIFILFDDTLSQRDFLSVDEFLQEVNVHKIDKMFLISILCCAKWAKVYLESYVDFYSRIKLKFIDEDTDIGILKGF